MRHQKPCTSSPRALAAPAAPRAPSITTACGTKYQRTATYTPGTTSSTSPAAIPMPASTTARKIGAKASSPDWSASRARGGVPEALEWIAWMQIALISGAITRKLTAVGRAVSATLGDES